MPSGAITMLRGGSRVEAPSFAAVEVRHGARAGGLDIVIGVSEFQRQGTGTGAILDSRAQTGPAIALKTGSVG